MAKISLTKSGLQKEKEHLKLYAKLLPSLELKHMQLRDEMAKANAEIVKLREEYERKMQEASTKLPMLANEEIELKDLVKISSKTIKEENIVGVKIPTLKEVKFDIHPYSLLAKPPWVDTLVFILKELATLKLKIDFMQKRVEILSRASRKVTQHFNLFDKILIPQAKKSIQKIQIALGDIERSQVVRSKMTKALNEREKLVV